MQFFWFADANGIAWRWKWICAEIQIPSKDSLTVQYSLLLSKKSLKRNEWEVFVCVYICRSWRTWTCVHWSTEENSTERLSSRPDRVTLLSIRIQGESATCSRREPPFNVLLVATVWGPCGVFLARWIFGHVMAGNWDIRFSWRLGAFWCHGLAEMDRDADCISGKKVCMFIIITVGGDHTNRTLSLLLVTCSMESL